MKTWRDRGVMAAMGAALLFGASTLAAKLLLNAEGVLTTLLAWFVFREYV